MSAYKIVLLGMGLSLATPAFAAFLPSFDCSRSPMNDGFVCAINKVADATSGFYYSQPIVALVPDGVDQPTNVVLHFHGFRNVCDDDTIENMLSSFGFLEMNPQLRELNAIFVIPRSVGQETTFNEELTPHFDAFVKWIQSEVGKSHVIWRFTGHSGAYVPIGAILKNSRIKIKNVVLLDATYSKKSSYYQLWVPALKKNRDMRVYSVTSASTAQGTRMLTKVLNKYKIPAAIQTATTPHCDIPKKDLGLILADIVKRL